MTIKELSDVAGVSQETVRRTGKELFPMEFKNGIKTVFAKSQCFDIMAKLPKKNLVQMSEQPTQPVEQPTQSVEQPTQSVEVIAQAVAMAMQTVMLPMMEKIMNMNKPSLQIEAPKEDYFSLLAYCSIHEIKTNRSELAIHGKSLRKMTLGKGLTLKKIPDERWGQVNSYPVEILDEYFRV